MDPSNKDIIVLSFRFRNQSASATPASASRITRRFLAMQHTTDDVLNYVESLELRPLGTEFDLTLDYPTRILNRSVCRSLKEAGVTTDSVVWIKFADE